MGARDRGRRLRRRRDRHRRTRTSNRRRPDRSAARRPDRDNLHVAAAAGGTRRNAPRRPPEAPHTPSRFPVPLGRRRPPPIVARRGPKTSPRDKPEPCRATTPTDERRSSPRLGRSGPHLEPKPPLQIGVNTYFFRIGARADGVIGGRRGWRGPLGNGGTGARVRPRTHAQRPVLRPGRAASGPLAELQARPDFLSVSRPARQPMGWRCPAVRCPAVSRGPCGPLSGVLP